MPLPNTHGILIKNPWRTNDTLPVVTTDGRYRLAPPPVQTLANQAIEWCNRTQGPVLISEGGVMVKIGLGATCTQVAAAFEAARRDTARTPQPSATNSTPEAKRPDTQPAATGAPFDIAAFLRDYNG